MSPETNSRTEEAKWDAAWPEETVRLAYEEGAKATEVLIKWADALDTKTIAIATANSAILTLVATLRKDPVSSGVEGVLWVLAFLCWLRASWACYESLAPKKFRHGPHPGLIGDADWLSISPAEYRFFRLRFLGRTFQANVDVIAEKGTLLRTALAWGAAETLLLVLAQVVRLVRPVG